MEAKAKIGPSIQSQVTNGGHRAKPMSSVEKLSSNLNETEKERQRRSPSVEKQEEKKKNSLAGAPKLPPKPGILAIFNALTYR